jgi:hypothetical protein
VLEGAALDFANEVAELQAFLDELAKRPPQESKMERLRDALMAAFHGKHDTAVVFTQYTDPLAYLRSQRLPTFGTPGRAATSPPKGPSASCVPRAPA